MVDAHIKFQPRNVVGVQNLEGLMSLFENDKYFLYAGLIKVEDISEEDLLARVEDLKLLFDDVRVVKHVTHPEK